MPGLKMPLSGMVENTTIIHSGNSQTSASGARTACSAMLRQRLAGATCDPHAGSLPSQSWMQRDDDRQRRDGVGDRRGVAEIERR